MSDVTSWVFLKTEINEVIDSMYKALLLYSWKIRNFSLCFYRIDRINVDKRFLTISKVNPWLRRDCFRHSWIFDSILGLIWGSIFDNAVRNNLVIPSGIEKWVWTIRQSSEISWRIAEFLLLLLLLTSEVFAIFNAVWLKLG